MNNSSVFVFSIFPALLNLSKSFGFLFTHFAKPVHTSLCWILNDRVTNCICHNTILFSNAKIMQIRETTKFS